MWAGAIDKAWPCLAVAGSADPYHDPAAHAEVCRAIGAQSLVIDGANHGLVVPADVLATVDGFRTLTGGQPCFRATWTTGHKLPPRAAPNLGCPHLPSVTRSPGAGPLPSDLSAGERATAESAGRDYRRN